MLPMLIFENQEALDCAVRMLVQREPRFAGVVEVKGPPLLRTMKGGLASLLRTITEQLLSLQSAQTIWTRIEKEIRPLDTENLLKLGETGLRDLGLSGSKARTFLAVSNAVASGQLDFDHLHALSDEETSAILQRIKGIGPWTADIYLLQAMGRANAWPAADLALQVAAADLFGLKARPGVRDMNDLASSWQPVRSAAAHLLWSHYRQLKKLPNARC